MQYANSWMCWSLQPLQTAWCCRNLSLYLDVQRCEWRSWSNKSSWIRVDSASVVVEVRSLSKFKIVCSSFHAAAIEQIRNENKPQNGPLLVQPLLQKEAYLANLWGVPLSFDECSALHDPSFPDQLLGFSQLSTLLSALLTSFGTAVIDGTSNITSESTSLIDLPKRCMHLWLECSCA